MMLTNRLAFLWLLLCLFPVLGYAGGKGYDCRYIKKDTLNGLRYYFAKFKEIPRPEKTWALLHPFVAAKAWRVTREVKLACANLLDDPDLDGDSNGGQCDALRHGYWMALLTQRVGTWRALSLGKAHERSGFMDYKNRRTEDGMIPDRVGGEMDLKNNEIGAAIARANKKASPERLYQIIKTAVLNGKFWVVKKDKFGNYVDWEGNVLSKEDYQGKWDNKKCLVPSNFVYKR